MSKFAFARIAAAVAVFALPLSSALAMDMTATATITATCKMSSTNTLTFDTSDQVTAPALSPTVDVSYKCTAGTTPSALTLNGSGSPFTGSLKKGTDTIAYTVTWGALGQGTGFTTAVPVTLSAAMAGAAYQNAPAGTYTQTVAVEVTP